MPVQYFIKAYQGDYINAVDYSLIETAIQLNSDLEGLLDIGNVLLKMYSHDAVANCYLGPSIYRVAKKSINSELGQEFTKKAINDLLKVYSNKEVHKKIAQVATPQPMYFNYKGNSEKLSEEVYDSYRIGEK